jgi:hypothetical protein
VRQQGEERLHRSVVAGGADLAHGTDQPVAGVSVAALVQLQEFAGRPFGTPGKVEDPGLGAGALLLPTRSTKLAAVN